MQSFLKNTHNVSVSGFIFNMLDQNKWIGYFVMLHCTISGFSIRYGYKDIIVYGTFSLNDAQYSLY